jgi:hypothetical protein
MPQPTEITQFTFGQPLRVVGLPPNIANAVDQGVQYAEAAVNLVGNIASGNIVGAVLGVTGLFGGGSSGDKMFNQQILQGINQILDNQRVIIKGINALLEGQKEILQTLYDIETQLQKNQQETLARFDRLDSKLLQVQITLVELQATDCDQCRQLKSFGTTEWAKIATWLNDENIRGAAYSSCKAGIQHLIISPIEPPTSPTDLFSLSYFRFDNNPALVTIDSRQAAETYRDQIDDVFNYFNSSFNNDAARRSALLLLWSAPLRPSLASSVTRQDFSIAEGDLNNAFPTKINYAAVKRAVEYVLAAHQFMDLEDRSGPRPQFHVDLLPSGSSGTGPNYDEKDQFGFAAPANLAALQKLDKLTDLALAQQALLGGISLFEKIGDGLEKGDKATIDLLRNHPTIAVNYVHWRLRNTEARPIPAANAAYSFAFQSKDEAYMRGFIRGMGVHYAGETSAQQCADGSYAPIPKGWSAKLADCLYISFPTAEEFASDLFRITPGFYDLHDAKIQLRDAILQYQFGQTNGGQPAVDEETFRYAVKRAFM